MHTFSQAGSAKDNNNKVLEEKSPRGSKGSIKASSKNVPGFFTDTMKQRDSFPPYDAMGSEKNASARQSEVDVVKKNKVSPLDLDDSKSDAGFNNVLDKLNHSKDKNDDEKHFLSSKTPGESNSH